MREFCHAEIFTAWFPRGELCEPRTGVCEWGTGNLGFLIFDFGLGGGKQIATGNLSTAATNPILKI
jgi:hypothetical protein